MVGTYIVVEIGHADDEPFQLFLVSVQLGSSLIGEMTSEDSAAMATCRNTSLQHSDLANKTSVSLSWHAPADITATQVIVR